MFPQFTYSELKKTHKRDEIMVENVSSVGTKAGNYGAFTEHFKALSANGAESLKSELEYAAKTMCVDYNELMELLPKLKELIDGTNN